MFKHLPLPIRFPAPHKRTLYAVFVLLWLSGALWLGFHYFLRVAGEFGATANPLEIWWLRLHGLMGFAALVVTGSVLPVHARRAWHLKKNRVSGLGMQLLLAWLALTGYALYYFATDDNTAWLPLLHWVVGLAFPLLLVWHIRHGRTQAASLSVQTSINPPASAFSASQPTTLTPAERKYHAPPGIQTEPAGRTDRSVI